MGALARLGASALAIALALTAPAAMAQKKAPKKPAADWTDLSVAELQKAMGEGRVTSRDITAQFLARIKAIDKAGPKLNAVIELNPDALAIAGELDRERQAKGPRGPLHGVPVLLKDNIATADRM